MGQKANPISLRLQKTTRDFDNCWYSNYFYGELIARDLAFQKYIDTFFRHLKLPSTRIAVLNFPKKSQIFTFFCYPKAARLIRSRIFRIPNTLSFSKTTGQNQLVQYLPQLEKGDENLEKTVAFLENVSTQYQKGFEFPAWVFKAHTRFQNKNSQNLVKLLFNSSIKSIHGWSLDGGNRVDLIKKSTSNRIPKGEFTQNPYSLEGFVAESPKSRALNNLLLEKFQDWGNEKFRYKNYFQSFLENQTNVCLDYFPFGVREDWQSANFLADELVYYIEKRVPFRLLKTRILKNLVENPAIRGVRITWSGRVGGKSKKAQRAKTECIKYGETCLHVFSSQIDFAIRTAFTPFGSVGIKVWICYN